MKRMTESLEVRRKNLNDDGDEVVLAVG